MAIEASSKPSTKESDQGTGLRTLATGFPSNYLSSWLFSVSLKSKDFFCMDISGWELTSPHSY